MDSTKLKYFVSAARNLNFSEVARFNFISQPTISHQIALLEEELQVKLFYRNGKKLALTKEGEYFLPIAVKLLEDMNNAAVNVKQYSEGTYGKIDIMISETCVSIFTECLKVFSKRYPNIVINADFQGTSDLIEGTITDTHNIYFSFDDIIRLNKTLEYIHAADDCLCLALPNNVPAPENIDDFSCLKDVPYIGLSNSSSTFLISDISELLERRNFTPKLMNVYNKLRELLLSVEIGIGFSIVPYSIALEHTPKITCIPINDESCKAHRVIAWSNSNRSQAVDLFIEVAKELYEK